MCDLCAWIYGIYVELDCFGAYTVLLSQPVRARIAIVDPPGQRYEAKLAEDYESADPLTGKGCSLSSVIDACVAR